ncbi:MAG: bifunctional glutamate N-acetyltransferase/amino-acid acetyltransferase ArgJ [Actinomycetaceae bacterium]|nr:bifunctional glutamate N-acetyltransferase/amino-acid acetyltransferase ArgJ [Actinomycetaceae bacterium]
MSESLGVCYPRGFEASAIAAGLKASGKLDLALVVNTGRHVKSAGVFTSNRVVAAPVEYTRKLMKTASISHVIVNSGNANACTGQRGVADVALTVAAVAEACQIAPDTIGVCSTGVIGEYLDIEKLGRAVPQLVKALSCEGGSDASRAIMTTDTVAKTVELDCGGWRIGGMAKGAGMLAPALATMLCVITLDAVVDERALQRALTHAVNRSFDRLDTDGCMSTNDSVIVLASGESGKKVSESELTAQLTDACVELTRSLQNDAEGASHTIDINVRGASAESAAVAVGRTVARSALVKTAIFGNDPNWGRILSQIGTLDEQTAPFDPSKVDVAINGIEICRSGSIGEPKKLVDIASNRHVAIDITLHAGDANATIYTTDLTHDYVHENSAYTT